MSTGTLTRRRPRAVDEPAIDPRIADRREAVQREHRRRRRRTLLALCVVTVLAIGAVGLTRSAALDVDHIEVLGADRTTEEALIGTSGLSLGAPMTELDLGGAERAIAELPWIAEVRVERRWPNRVAIVVRERTPVAAVPAVEGRWALVDETGQVLTVAEAVSDRWVAIEGLPLAEDPGTQLGEEAGPALEVAGALPADLRDGLERIVRDERGELRLRFRTGPTVRLGTIDDLDAKLAAALAVFRQVDDCGLDVIDVRAVDQVAVTRVAACRAGVTAPDADGAADPEAGGGPAGEGAATVTTGEAAGVAADGGAVAGAGDG